MRQKTRDKNFGGLYTSPGLSLTRCPEKLHIEVLLMRCYCECINTCHSHSHFSSRSWVFHAQMFPFILGHIIHRTTEPFQLKGSWGGLLSNHWLKAGSTMNIDLDSLGCGHSVLDGWPQAQGSHNLSGQPSPVLHVPHKDFGFDSLSLAGTTLISGDATICHPPTR